MKTIRSDTSVAMAGPYGFRPVVGCDLALLRRWLETPEVRRWWGDPDEQAGLLEADLDNPHMVMEIVTLYGRPFAYVQHYDVHTWPHRQFARLPAGSRAIDALIGEPGMLGAGHGPAFLRGLAERLCADGAPAVAIDPHPDNLRARRAYEKAGFSGDLVVDTEEGPAVVMTFARASDAG